MVRLSKDHKPENEVDRIKQKGGFVSDKRVNGTLAVSRAFGDFYLEELIICEPTVATYKFPSEPDAFILLCCDGVWDEIDDEQACSVILDHTTSPALEDFFRACTALRYEICISRHNCLMHLGIIRIVWAAQITSV